MKKYVDYYAVPTLEVESPFSYKHVVLNTEYVDIGPQREMVDSIESRVCNYRSYDIHCFFTQFSRMIKDIKPSLSFSLIHKRSEDTTKLFIELREGSSFYPITESNKPIIEEMVKMCSEKSDHILLFSPTSDIYYKDTCIPHEWMASVLPYAEIPDTVMYSDSEQRIERHYHKGGIYIKLDPDSCYTDIAQVIRFSLYDYLLSLYLKGCVVLSSILDEEFIERWDLERSNMCDTSDYALYCPKWRNAYAAKNPTEFLTERLLGDTWTRFDVGNDERLRYSISMSIKNTVHVYCDRYLMVRVMDVKELNSVTSMLLASKSIEVTEEAVTYEDVHRGTIRIK